MYTKDNQIKGDLNMTTPTNYKAQATALYNYGKFYVPAYLDEALTELSAIYDEDRPICDLEEWLEEFNDNVELIQIAQQADHFNVNDEYIRDGIYYSEFTTGNQVTSLVDESEALLWIEYALKDHPDYLSELTKLMKEGN